MLTVKVRIGGELVERVVDYYDSDKMIHVPLYNVHSERLLETVTGWEIVKIGGQREPKVN